MGPRSQCIIHQITFTLGQELWGVHGAKRYYPFYDIDHNTMLSGKYPCKFQASKNNTVIILGAFQVPL